jgi:carbon storage regulator
MIELSRNVGESIMVGDVKITVISVNIANKQVSIGIEAPKNVSIYRSEKHDLLNEDTEKPQSFAFTSI